MSLVWVQRRRGLRLTRVRGVPLPRPALSLGDLFGGHLGGDDVVVLDAEVAVPTASCSTSTLAVAPSLMRPAQELPGGVRHAGLLAHGDGMSDPSYCWLVETVTKRNGSPRVPCRTRRASQRTAARCAWSSASTMVSAAASIRSSACARRTGVLRTYREVVVMLA